MIPLRQEFLEGSVRAVFHSFVSPLPGCDTIAVSHSLFREGSPGFGYRAVRERLRTIKELGFSAVLCTVELTNGAQLKLMKSEGWSQVATLTSRKTGHDLGLFFRTL